MSALAEGLPSTLLGLWRKVRQLRPVYAAIAESFHFTPPPSTDVATIDMNDEDVFRIAAWIEEIDAVSQPHHLRTVLQELDVCSSDLCVSTWLQHFLSKPARVAADRDKIDFLLSHYLRMNLPPSLQEGKPNLAAMRAILEPVLGSCESELPEEAREIDELIGIAERCRSLAEFEQSGIIRRGRELKLRSGESYFTPVFLLAFTHFNAVVRRECLRLMDSDLKFIGDALNRLEQQGITHIDCTAANWSEREPVSELKNKWATWELASNDYSQDFFAKLIAFRSSVEEALERCIELSMTSVSQELRSIHSLLLEMRSQIDELPRRFGQVTSARTADQSVPAAAKPVLVWQASAKPAPALPTEMEPAATKPSIAKASVAPASSVEPHTEPVAKSQSEPSVAEAAPVVSEKAVAPTLPSVAPQAKAATAAVAVAAKEFPGAAPAAIVQQQEEGTAVVTTAPQGTSEIEEKPQQKAVAAETPAKSAETQQAVEPTTSAATAPIETASSSAAPGAVDLEAGIARLQKTLSGKRPTAVSIAVAGTRILLTAAEASMFSVADNRFAKGVQRAVMMRICLVSALENHSKTQDKSGVAALVPCGRTERATMQELIAECKTNKLAREEEILSATAKQLAAMLDRAERIAR